MARLIRLYASRTGTKANLEALRIHGWRMMISAAGVWRSEGFAYAIDNGAWSAYTRNVPWDPVPFRALIAMAAGDADFVVAPDIVMGGGASLELTKMWLPWLDTRVRQTLIAVQDGMNPGEIEPLLGSGMWRGIFVGGSLTWKNESLPEWGRLARMKDCWLHVGRVNSLSRIQECIRYGATSVDGSKASRYATAIPSLSQASEG